MPGSPPSYAALAYWDDRFTTTPTPFDWLLPANALDGALVAALDEYELRRVQDSMHDGLLLDDPNVESGAERRQQPPCQQKQGERQRGRSSSMAEAAKDDEEGSSLQGKHLGPNLLHIGCGTSLLSLHCDRTSTGLNKFGM